MITNHTIYVDLASLICQYIWTFINYKYREMEQWEFSNSYSINCKNKEEGLAKEMLFGPEYALLCGLQP